MKVALIRKRNKLGRFIGNKIYLKYYCKICKKEIHFATALYGSYLCHSCNTKKQLKNFENHGKYKDGFYTKKRFCLDCKQQVFSHSRTKYCKLCVKKHQIYPNRQGKNSYSFGKKVPNKRRLKISKFLLGKITKNTIAKHHLDLNTKNNNESNIFILTNSTHQLFHRLGYHYILKKYGIKEILKYKKWFTKHVLQGNYKCKK